MGHLLIENRHGLIVDADLTQATGYAERDSATVMLGRLPTSGCRMNRYPPPGPSPPPPQRPDPRARHRRHPPHIHRWAHTGLTETQADQLACGLGTHPALIWTNWPSNPQPTAPTGTNDRAPGAASQATEARPIYEINAHDLSVEFVNRLATNLQDDSGPHEISRLGRILARWATQITKWHRSGLSNGPIEAINNLTKRIKRIGFGLRRVRNYRIRPLLYAGRPKWALLDTHAPQ